MSKNKHSETEFKNENTVRRRAWIAKALEGVRGRLDYVADDMLVTEKAAKPDLYIVKADDQA